MTVSSPQGSIETREIGSIEVVAALVRNRLGHVLLVRKQGTTAFMQPGGKREPGESDLAALKRELSEEIGCPIVSESAVALGMFEDTAAHEPGLIVRAAIYEVRIAGEVKCGAEIAQTIWLDPRQPGDTPLAPLTRNAVLPLALATPQAR
jgi:8-oxo-dGTP diphosphatase